MSRVAPSGDQVVLRRGDQEAVVVEVGGGLRTYEVGGQPVLDGYAEDEMCAGGRGQVLLPWPNRVGDGRYRWAGADRQLALTEPAAGNAIHGLVRWAAWRARPLSTSEVVMEHVLHPQPGWGWTLDLSVTYALDDDGLTVTVMAANESDDPVPWGAGFHPYLHAFGGLVDDAVLRLPAATRYLADARGLPTGTAPVEGTEYDFRAGRPIGGLVLDTAFTDLGRDRAGRAEIELAAGPSGGPARRRLWMDESFSHVMVFSGDTLGEGVRRRGLAVEPMTAPPDMLRSGDGLRVLEPGGRFEASWGIHP